MIGFIIGFVLGSWFGVMIMAAVFMARDYERKHRKGNNNDG
jgi:hypothetical protein